MTAISVVYKKNTTGEQHPPPEQIRIAYLRPDGDQATDNDIADIQKLFAKAMFQAITKRRKRTDPVEPIWSEGGYRIEIERSDGLPLSLDEVQSHLAARAMRRFEGEDVELISIPKTTLAIVAKLPLFGFRAWAIAVQQLEPDSDEQIVTLAEQEGAQILMAAGLIERFDGGAENQYSIANSVACCKVERRHVDVD